MKRKVKFNGASSDGASGGQVTAVPSNGNAETANVRKTRILIVEDEPAMVAGLRDNFEYEGYEVISAGDGVVGLERALSDNPDLVVLDVMMPRMSGLDVCKQLKAKRPSLPIIMLTARGQEIDKVVGLELGADDYVTKPFSIRELMARVKAVLRRVSPQAPAPHGRFIDSATSRSTSAAMKCDAPASQSNFRQKSLRCSPTSSLIPRKRSAATGCWMRCGVMRTIRTRAQSTHTSSISGKSWNQILRSRVSFLPFTAVVTNSSVEVTGHESNSNQERIGYAACN